ncbi:hypothetical protein [Nocardioides convexus]|uniref:hypothetical protein n=1 Tax=Nocardioides convexus TaxID=2712224 RepID=UPI0024189AD5|nr:hypothetical protein [Nocardioides convexus]
MRVPPPRIPHGRTARRVQWAHLPPRVRAAIERRLGGTVASAQSQDGGFTPGFASVLTLEDGSRHFVKAASGTAQRAFAASYRDEAVQARGPPGRRTDPAGCCGPTTSRTGSCSPPSTSRRAPRTALGPTTTWPSPRSLTLTTAAALTPAPTGATSAAEEFASWPGLWDVIDHPRAAEIGALAAACTEVVTGDTLAHTDVRDDNILIVADGAGERALLCDWNWPVRGPAWLDSLLLLVGPRGDGLDVEAHLAAHPLLSGVPSEEIDVVLALVLGYFTASAAQRVPPTSPYLRAAQAWQRDVIDDWLAERRGWRTEAR